MSENIVKIISVEGNFQLLPISQIMALDHTKAENHPDCNVAHHKQYTKPLGRAAHSSIQAKKTMYTITKQLYGMLRHAQKNPLARLHIVLTLCMFTLLHLLCLLCLQCRVLPQY